MQGTVFCCATTASTASNKCAVSLVWKLIGQKSLSFIYTLSKPSWSNNKQIDKHKSRLHYKKMKCQLSLPWVSSICWCLGGRPSLFQSVEYQMWRVGLKFCCLKLGEHRWCASDRHCCLGLFCRQVDPASCSTSSPFECPIRQINKVSKLLVMLVLVVVSVRMGKLNKMLEIWT